MKKILSLLLFAAMTVTSAWGYNGTITFDGQNGDNRSSSCTFNGIAAGSYTLTITSPYNDGYSIKTINVSGGGYTHEYTNNEIRTALNNAGATYNTFNTNNGDDHDGVYAIAIDNYFQFNFTTSSSGNITVTIKYKNWERSDVWPLTLEADVPTDIRIAATHSRTAIYEHGDFAGLYVSSVNSTILDDENARFEWQYSNDNNTWYSGDDYLPDNDSHNNIRPSEAGYYRYVAILSGDTIPSNAIQITTTTHNDEFLYANSANTETNLPILVIRTTSSKLPGWDNGQPGAGVSPEKTKTSADMKLIWNPNGVNKLSDMNDNYQGNNIPYDRRVRINWRGSTSRTMAKRSLAISAGKKDIVIGGKTDGFEKDKFDFFGGPEEKDWILYSAYQDKSMMRNKLAMDLWKSMGYWAGDCTFVEVYIDGEYQGVYVFMDKYERSGDRIKVTKQGEGNGADGQTTGYVLKFDKVNLDDPGTWYRGNISAIKGLNNNNCGSDGGCGDPAARDTKQGWEIAYPDPDGDLTSPEEEYIKEWLTEFEVALYDAYKGQNNMTYDSVFQNYLDLQSFADFMILEELARNTDGYRASMYFSKDVDGKLKCVAPWDFEMGFGNSRTHGGSLTNIWEYAYGASEECNKLSNGKNEPYYPIPFWWKALMESTCFKNALKTRWDALTADGKPLNKDVVWARIDAMVSQLNAKGAVNREMQKWDWVTRNSCVIGCTTPAYNNCPWIIVPWGDRMENSDEILIHPIPTRMPDGFTWGNCTEDNGGKKTLTYDNEYMLMKGWIADRLYNLNNLINSLGASEQTPEEMRECAQAEEYMFTVNADSTEICNDGTEEAVLTVGHNITSTCDLTYQWYKDGATMSGKTKKTLSVTEPGDYYCAVTINRLGGIPTILYQNVASDTVKITTRSCGEPVDDSDLVPVENNNTICITCQTAQKRFTITANGTDFEGNPDKIRSVKITKDNNPTPLYNREMSTTTTTTTVTLDAAFTSGKYVVEVKTNKYKIVKTYWK